MDPDDIKDIQKRISVKSIDCHPTENAIILNCEVDTSFAREDFDDYFAEGNKECQRIIRLQSLNGSSDPDLLAEQVIKKSGHLLSSSHFEEIKQIINYLKKRKSPSETATGAKINSFRPKTASSCSNGYHSDQNGIEKSFFGSDLSTDSFVKELSKDLKLNEIADAQPSLTFLDSYIELLYEDFQDKIKGSALIFYLSTNRDNLAVLSKNETLLCALARLLREDGRKSLDLSTYITATFACFSLYTQFHPAISQFKVGSLCFDLIHLELEREESWFRELAEIQSAIVYRTRTASVCSSLNSSLQSSTLSVASAPGGIDSGFNSISSEYQKSLRKYQSLLRKQNQFIRVAFNVLFNLSQDVKVEQKMVNKGIIVLLTRTLERDITPELLMLVVNFLTKLSIYKRNKDEMIQVFVVEKLFPVFCNFLDNQILVEGMLQLLFNLSFDMNLRTTMIKCGYLPKLIQLLSKSQDISASSEKLLYQILYHLSRSDKAKNMFNFTAASGIDCIHLMMHRLFKQLDSPEAGSTSTLKLIMALMINLASNRRNAQLICEDHQLQKLINKAIENYRDSNNLVKGILLLKLVRNISQHDDPFKMVFLDYIEQFIEILTNYKPKNPHVTNLDCFINGDFDEYEEMFVVEVLGILGNLNNLSQINWLELFKKHNLFDWITVRLKPGSAFEDDMILDCVILLGTACQQLDCCIYLLESNCTKVLVDLLNAKQEDDEIVLQIIYVFHLMSGYNMVKDSQIPAYLIDLMNDKNPAIKAVCNATLDIMSENDPELAEKVLVERFKSYNKQWLEMIQSQQQMDVFDDFGVDYCNSAANMANNYSFLVRSDFSSPENEKEERASHKEINSPIVDPVGVRDEKFEVTSDVPMSTSRPHTGYKKRALTASINAFGYRQKRLQSAAPSIVQSASKQNSVLSDENRDVNVIQI